MRNTINNIANMMETELAQKVIDLAGFVGLIAAGWTAFVVFYG